MLLTSCKKQRCTLVCGIATLLGEPAQTNFALLLRDPRDPNMRGGNGSVDTASVADSLCRGSHLPFTIGSLLL